MSLSYSTARRIVDAWRELAPDNATARTFVSLCDAMPTDDRENYVAGVIALCAGIPRQLSELHAVAREVVDVYGDLVYGPKPPPGLDPIAFIGTADADR